MLFLFSKSPPNLTSPPPFPPASMPPRKRQKLMRIDAALDAMRPMGFPDTLVRKTVRVLLKEYGGNESWPFIEEASYKVLIETLLETQKKEEEEGRDDCDEEEGQCEKNALVTNDEAGGLVQNVDNGDERESVDQHLELYEQGVDDEDVCQQDGVDNENHLSPKDVTRPTGFEEHIHPASSSTPPLVDCAPAIRRRTPCYGWISDDD